MKDDPSGVPNRVGVPTDTPRSLGGLAGTLQVRRSARPGGGHDSRAAYDCLPEEATLAGCEPLIGRVTVEQSLELHPAVLVPRRRLDRPTSHCVQLLGVGKILGHVEDPLVVEVEAGS
jgi:hypothetical protein